MKWVDKGSLKYAAAAITPSTRSRTTGDVLGDIITSSRVPRNFLDVDCEMNVSVQLRSMMAHSLQGIVEYD